MKRNDVMTHLSSVWQDWQGELANPNYAIISDSLVAWGSFDISMTPHFMTVEHVRTLVQSRQYSFQVASDGSVLQLLYQYRRDELVAARLAYFAGRPIMPESEAPEVSDEDGVSDADRDEAPEDRGPVPLDWGADAPMLPVSWLRLDYDPRSARGVMHAAAHVQASIGVSMRIPTNGVPTPRQWIEAVFAWFYPNVYAARHLSNDGQFRDPKRLGLVNRGPGFRVRCAEEAIHVFIPEC